MQICYLRGEKITLDLAKLLSVREVVKIALMYFYVNINVLIIILNIIAVLT